MLSESMISSKEKRASSFTILVATSLIATLFVASLSYYGLPQALGQGLALNPATTQLISQTASQVARAQGVDSAQVNQVLQQIAVQISNSSGSATAIQAIAQISAQVAIDAGQGPVSQSLAQLARQQASGQSVNQAIVQVGRQVAQGGDVSQVLVQVAQQSAQPQGGQPPTGVTQQITQVAQ